MNWYRCTTDDSAADNGFVGPRILCLAFPIDPFVYERSSYYSVGSIRPPMPEENSPYGILLADRNQPGFVCRVGIRLRSGEETRPHYYAIGAQTEGSRKPSPVGDTPGGEDQRGRDGLHYAGYQNHGGDLTGHMSASLSALRNDHVNSRLVRPNGRID